MVKIANRFGHGHTSLIHYTFDWTEWLAAGETLASAEWTADDPTLTIGDGAGNGPAPTVFESDGRQYAMVWIGDAEVGKQYVLTCRATTSIGQIDEESVLIVGVDR